MFRLTVSLILASLLVPAALAQTDGFLVTDTDGDTLFYSAPDGTVQFGPNDARVRAGDDGEGLTSTVTAADGSPSAGIFTVDNAASAATALLGTTNGPGVATSGQTFGQGTAGGFFNYDASNPEPSLWTFTIGSGSALLAQQNGVDGNAGEFLVTDATSNGSAVYARTDGLGGAGSFFVDNASSTFAAVFGRTVGIGAGVYGRSVGSGSAVYGSTDGTGSAGSFAITNEASGAASVFGTTNGASGGTGVHGRHTGVGSAVYGEQSGPGGIAGLFKISDAGNSASAVQGETVGTGGAGTFIINNPANTFSAVYARSDGSGASIQGRSLGSGDAVFGRATGGGTAIQGLQASTSGWAGKFDITDASNGEAAVLAVTDGSGSAVSGVSSEGAGGKFSTSSTSTTSTALDAITNGAGSALRAIQNSGSGSTVAEFAVADYGANYNTVMRVATNGNVYADGAFNGGGADFAERFEVVGEMASYEIGDVLSISTQQDRHLERSAEPYSTRILGVYATRPGVLLGDPSISPEETVPVGVVGVVPTKVTSEGGPIRRGDMLVTSSTVGHAMRGEPGRVGVGMVIGKALQDFDGTQGVIEVMVNVQ